MSDPSADAEARADEVMALIREISRDEVAAAIAKTNAGHASRAIQDITNGLHARHEHQAAEAVTKSWNSFVKVIQPLWMDGPCSHDHTPEPFECYCGWVGPL